MQRWTESFVTGWTLLIALIVGLAGTGMHDARAQEPPIVPNGGDPGSQCDDSINKVGTTNPDPVRSPELVAIAWQLIPNNPIEDLKQVDQPAWRPDGTLLSTEEANKLRELAGGFQAHWWNKDSELRPLVLVFRADSKILGGMMPRIALPDGQYASGGSWGNYRDAGLTKSASSPFRHSLASWPDKVDLEIKVPIDNWTIIKTLDEIPDEPVEIAPGVRWYLDPQRGIDRSVPNKPIRGLKATVLEQRTNPTISLANYDVKVWLKDKEESLGGGYSTIIEPTPDQRLHIEVSQPIDDVSQVKKVEILRKRFRFDLIKDVHTHLDLMP